MHSPVDKQKGKGIQGAHATTTHKTVSEVAHKTLSQGEGLSNSKPNTTEVNPSNTSTSTATSHPMQQRSHGAGGSTTLQDGTQGKGSDEPESEAIHQVGIDWWIDEIRLNIEPRWQSVGGRPLQATQMATSRPISDINKKLVHDILGLNPAEPLPDLPNRFSMNIMLWNCRGAGNKNFHRHFKELIRIHCPDVVALFETKVMFSSMGLFFNNLGYTKIHYADPVGRSWGIWPPIPIQVSVSAFVANQQVIQATVK
ncbi:hypothetical protein LOK49_LG15G00590 [Camellia lanceoleosa]|uniref:Uncharacterized protein n=1 Tax=Camellia lanceoleosa TaxID=1840588 RepID=A0ACC0F1A2_9ERIC|nr:hypothetical protein LOK49_LG15G00590 [Camellia lanceoleosa]